MASLELHTPVVRPVTGASSHSAVLHSALSRLTLQVKLNNDRQLVVIPLKFLNVHCRVCALLLSP